MPRLGWLALCLALLVLGVAGCGDDSDDSSDSGADTTSTSEKPAETTSEAAGPPVGDRGGKAAADAFVACFKEPGFSPIRDASARQPAEIIAEEKGYEVEGMLMSSDGGVNSFFIQFFEDAAAREEATRELDLKFGSADVPQPLEQGSAAVTWVTKQVRAAVEPAVKRCLG